MAYVRKDAQIFLNALKIPAPSSLLQTDMEVSNIEYRFRDSMPVWKNDHKPVMVHFTKACACEVRSKVYYSSAWTGIVSKEERREKELMKQIADEITKAIDKIFMEGF